MERLQQTRLAALLVLVAVFGSGLIVGLAVDRFRGGTNDVAVDGEGQEMASEARETDRETQRPRRPAYRQVTDLSADQLSAMDSLSDDFGERVREISASMRPAWEEWEDDFEPLDVRRDSLRAEYEDRRRSVLDRTILEIKTLMTPAQVAEYDSLLAEARRRDRGRRRGGSRD